MDAGIATGAPSGRDVRPDGRVIQWHLEPHVAEAIFKDLAAEAGVTVLDGHRLRERTGVTKDAQDATRVARITMENGATFAGAIFVDATYEGDLMAQAKVSYTYGRESSAQYGEWLAGVRDRTPLHQFLVSVPAHVTGASGARGALLPEINAEPKAASGSADRKVQAFNYRLCMTKVAEHRVPFPKPRGMGSYNSDSHNVQRIVNAEGFAENERDMQVPVTPYQKPAPPAAATPR